MSNRLLLKRSATPGKVPVLTDLVQGELAFNSYDGRLFARKDNGTPSVVEIGGSSAGVITSVDSDFGITSGQLNLAPQPTVNALNIPANVSVYAPPAGTTALYSQSFSNKAQLCQMDSAGRPDPLQRSLYSNNFIVWMPNSGSTVASPVGTTWVAKNSGSGAAQSRPTQASGSAISQMARNNFGTGTTATGASGICSSEALAWMGNATNYGGFFFHARFALETYSASERFFVGLSANNATMAANASTWNNTVGIGKDSADGTLQFITRSATAVTRVDTAFTPSTTQVYDLYVYSAPNSGQVQFTLVDPLNINAPLASTTISTNVPVTTVFMYMQAHIQSTVGTTAKQLALSKMYLETDL